MARNPQLRCVIAFRVTSDTKAKLTKVARAHGVGPSAHARDVLLAAIDAAAVTPRVARRVMQGEQLRELLAELGRQGSNLNQVAHHLNAGGRVTEVRDAIDVLRAEHAAALRAVTSFLVGGSGA